MNINSKKMAKYYKIYGQLYEDPFILLPHIAQNMKLSEKEVYQLVADMYSHHILKGPMIFLTPAENYPLYVNFLKVKHPLTVFQRLTGSHILFKSMGVGDWDVLVISNTQIEVSNISGFKELIHHGEKGKTFCSQVTKFDWKQGITCVYTKETPGKKSSIYEKIPDIPWGKQEWELFETFKNNVRVDLKTKECDISEKYAQWVLQLPEYAVVKPAFYPEGAAQYWILDFLFCSQYQKQVTTMLSVLPTTALFFSTGKYLLARLWVKAEYSSDVYSAVSHLKESNYFSEMYSCNSLFTG